MMRSGTNTNRWWRFGDERMRIGGVVNDDAWRMQYFVVSTAVDLVTRRRRSALRYSTELLLQLNQLLRMN